MAKYMQLKINNSKNKAINGKKWKDPGAKLYDQCLNAFYSQGDIPCGTKQLNQAMKDGTYKQWPDFLKEVYLVAPVSDIKNSPYGVTPYSRSGCKYPHHIIRNGELIVSIPGLKHAWDQAFYQKSMTPEVKRHLNRHMKELEMEPFFHHGQLYWKEEAESWKQIDSNFRSIDSYLNEKLGINLSEDTMSFNESHSDYEDQTQVANGVNNEDYIRPLNRNDVTGEHFISWFFKMEEFEDSGTENFDFNILVNDNLIQNYCYGYFVDMKLEGIIRTRYDQEQKSYAISMLFVNTDKWRSGIGNSLMNYVVSKFGDHAMTLRVFALNSKAIALYVKYGFQKFKTDIYPDGPDSDPKFVGQEMYLMKRDAVHVVNDSDQLTESVDNFSLIEKELQWIESFVHDDLQYDDIFNEKRDIMDDDIDWIESYLTEDEALEKDLKFIPKYEILSSKSKYEGWIKYTIKSPDGHDAGYCIVNPKTGDCADVDTVKEYRRQGYMQYLIKYLIKFEGLRYVQVKHDNEIAISLYKKIGFVIELDYVKDEQNMYSMVYNEDPSKIHLEESNSLNEAVEEAPPSMPEETKEESMPKKTDKAESSKNGIRRKNLYIEFIKWCKDYNPKNTFGSIFDKDAFNVTYPFIPDEMRYFYRLSNPMLCVLGGNLTFFAAAELRKVNVKNSHISEMIIFAATNDDVRVFNVKDKKIYRGTEENGTLKLNEVLGDTFDTYLQKMIDKGDILNAPIEESTEMM